MKYHYSFLLEADLQEKTTVVRKKNKNTFEIFTEQMHFSIEIAISRSIDQLITYREITWFFESEHLMPYQPQGSVPVLQSDSFARGSSEMAPTKAFSAETAKVSSNSSQKFNKDAILKLEKLRKKRF